MEHRSIRIYVCVLYMVHGTCKCVVLVREDRTTKLIENIPV